jgi:ABC-2 type transport system ATP-binding protein
VVATIDTPTPTPTPTIDVRDLRMRYGRSDVLTGVSFTARPGEVVALLGPNGAGKTTVIEILEGFRTRSAGGVQVLGKDPAHGGERWRARVGLVLQTWRDHGKWRVRELLEHLALYYRAYAEEPRRHPWDIDDLIAVVGLAERSAERVARLSGGQRRRLDVAVGIVGRPDVLFLDEPTVGFDPGARRDFHELVRGIVDDDTTVLLTTHDLDEAEKLADRIVILAGGAIIADGSADELSAQVSTRAEVRWSVGGTSHVNSVDDAATFVRDLFRQHDDAITDIEVRRARLEDTYLSMVRQFEAGRRAAAVREFVGVAR